MQDKIRSRTIGNHTYHVRPLGSTAGGKLLIRLTKLAGPAVAALLADIRPGKALEQVRKAKAQAKAQGGAEEAKVDAAVERGWSILDQDASGLAMALREFVFRLEENDLEYLTSVLGMTTEVELPDGKRLPLTKERQELHWAGNYGEMFRWLGFALEVNYSGFFGSWGSITEALAALEKDQAPADAEEEKAS